MKIDNPGMTIEDIVNMIVYREAFAKFLKDIENNLRIQRAYSPDEGNILLTQADFIPLLIGELGKLEQFREKYMEEERKKEQQS